MKNREHVVGCVLDINRPLVMGFACTMWSFLKIELFPRFDIVPGDQDVLVPVWPVVLVLETQSVEQFVDCSG